MARARGREGGRYKHLAGTGKKIMHAQKPLTSKNINPTMTYTRSSKKPTTASKSSAVQKTRVRPAKSSGRGNAEVADAVPAILVITPEKKKPKQATAATPKSRNSTRRQPVARALNSEEKALIVSQRKSRRFGKVAPASPAAKQQPGSSRE